MNSCFLLWHTHTVGNDDDEKFIGVYASLANAEAAIQRVKDQPGFRDHPDGFEICEYPIGKDHWEQGFISWTEAMKSPPEGDQQ